MKKFLFIIKNSGKVIRFSGKQGLFINMYKKTTGRCRSFS